MSKIVALAIVLGLGACGAEIVDDTPNAGGADAPVSPSDDAGTSPDAAPLCANPRRVFLSFEGETLTDAQTSNSQQNRASWMTIASGTAPRYKSGAGDRDAQIQAIVDGLRAQLAAFPNIEIVTTRPTSGDYMMLVYGGQANQVGSRFGGAVQELDCDDSTTRNDVAWISDGVNGTQRIVNFSIGAIGFGLGLTATLDPNGCMCGWDNLCQQNNVPCTLSANIQRDPDARQRCAGAGATQNEIQAFTDGFCQ